VIEATCKTLVTQRLKQSGMAWTITGGQAILTLRSLIQSNCWQHAWNLLRTDFRKSVTVGNSQTTLPAVNRPLQPRIIEHLDYLALPLAVCT